MSDVRLKGKFEPAVACLAHLVPWLLKLLIIENRHQHIFMSPCLLRTSLLSLVVMDFLSLMSRTLSL